MQPLHFSLLFLFSSHSQSFNTFFFLPDRWCDFRAYQALKNLFFIHCFLHSHANSLSSQERVGIYLRFDRDGFWNSEMACYICFQ